MTRPYDDELTGRGYPTRTDPDTGDHEISLGTPTILGLFFALALVCAAFFGFGYTLGRRSAPAPTVATDPLNSSGAPKPTAGLAAQSTSPAEPSTAPAGPTTVVSLNAPSATPAPAQPAPVVATAPPPAAAPQPATANLQTATSFVVQVAAVSSQDVADILVSSLQKKGYAVAVHPGTQDKLLHVQIGPFTDKKDAQAMQARVIADGFNAIVK